MINKILFVLLQCIWGLPQTLIGLGFFIANRKKPHLMYRGSIDTKSEFKMTDKIGEEGPIYCRCKNDKEG